MAWSARPKEFEVLHWLIVCMAVWNLSLTLWRLADVASSAFNDHRDKAYTYIGADYPFIHPSLPREPASLTLQESVHYGGNGSEPLTSLEWNSITRHPRGFGRAILGPDRREFLVTFYHQLHCVREIQKGLYDKNDPEATPHHMKHCMDYLRQTLLCSAMHTLEEGDFMERNFETQRTGGDLTCWNWELVYEELGRDWDHFREWRDQHRELVGTKLRGGEVVKPK